MEEIILKAKMGPPVSKLVGNHVVVEKTLQNASIVETHKGQNRRITDKKPISHAMLERRIKAAVDDAKGKTKAQGQLTLPWNLLTICGES